MNREDFVHHSLDGATKQERDILTPGIGLRLDSSMTKWVSLTPQQRVENLIAHGAPNWEIEYWEDIAANSST